MASAATTFPSAVAPQRAEMRPRWRLWWPTIDSSRDHWQRTGRRSPRSASRHEASASTICSDMSSRPPNAPPTAG